MNPGDLIVFRHPDSSSSGVVGSPKGSTKQAVCISNGEFGIILHENGKGVFCALTREGPLEFLGVVCQKAIP